jgi:hypothetical protein
MILTGFSLPGFVRLANPNPKIIVRLKMFPARNDARLGRGSPPLAKEGYGGFEIAPENPPQSPFVKGGSDPSLIRLFSDWG